ncbi:Voltage-gated Ion Channel [Phytophthora megakarya]|uniref:Voltage-gated Ion Channel n=1 Tax=Phytophthora megakarya TaxID=4795 RepID=A0A225X1M7_9STRA|nr:Voltage-gated Ion Channel [Phytophthora megakarya]
MIYFRTKKELSDLFQLPDVSMWGRRFNRLVFILILLGIADLAIKTCDGPNYGSTDPGYPYLPTEADHEIYDGLFAGAFTLEFLGRIIETRNARTIIRDPFMWLDLIGISPWYIVQISDALGGGEDVEHTVNLLRLLRTARLAFILRHYDQSKIIALAIKASLRPLGITLFFLFTLVMVIATAIFYAEPCYNVETCTFTDIFNSAYFVMVTVATVGYGNQVPSLKNPGSMMLTMIAMILGQIYFSMPVAIIGNNFKLTHENFQLDKKKKARYLDASLSPFDCQNLHSHAKRLCDIQYHLLKAWSIVHIHISDISRTRTRSTQSMAVNMLESETEHQIKIKEGMDRLLEVHAEAVAFNHQCEAAIVNQTMVGFALVSVMIFFTESLQELAASGVETNGCKSVVESYCSSIGFHVLDPACFVRQDNGTSNFTEQLHFSCSNTTQSRSCYGNGLNFGSLNSSALSCQDAFLEDGVDIVCYRQQCRASVSMIFDMGPYWIYFEWLFGLVFSVELAFRFYVSQNRNEFWKNIYVFFDVVAILPFFVEFSELLFAHIQPDYAIVATEPSFFSVIRVLKIMRILKLTRHFRGTKVLASTAIKVWKPLVIPLFFLFTGCIIAGAVFFEIERGTECFVGEACMWWHKDVLTPELAAGLPVGKRILIQDKLPTIITDMIHSTWLSYTTLTSVGFGDLTPRTSIGKFFDVFVIIVATIYSAMPLSLVGTQFYSLYEKHMEKMVVKQVRCLDPFSHFLQLITILFCIIRVDPPLPGTPRSTWKRWSSSRYAV